MSDNINAAALSKAAELNPTQDKYQLSLESMLKAGVHFGHKKSRWNPKMKDFLFGVRNGIHIIDLEKTKQQFQQALDFLGDVVAKNGVVLVVGTKKQAKDLVKAVADKVELPYVNERWLGGTFTNFPTISKRVKYLVETKEGLEKGKFNDLTKFERLKLQKEMEKMQERVGGLVTMKKLPEAICVLDVKKDEIAIKEAKRCGVKVVALVDSNCDPTVADYVIPANDDALSALKYIMGVFLKKMLEVKKSMSLVSEKK